MTTRTFRPRSARAEILGHSRWALIIGRWLVGKPARGQSLTNATWRHAGDTSLDRTKVTVARRHYRPGWHKMLVRNGVLWGFLLLVWMLLAYRAELLSTLKVLGVIFAIPAGVAVHQRVQDHQKRKTYLIPLAKWYAAQFGVPTHDALQRITIPHDHAENPDVATTIQLPADHVPSDNQAASHAAAVATKLGLSDPDWNVDHIGVPLLAVSAAPAPPALVTLEDILPYLNTPDDETYVVGLGRRRSPVYQSWGLDSPHELLSFESGMGKTNYAAGLTLQTIRKGGEVDIFDFAKHGESVADWCRDENGVMLPGVRVHLTVEAAHERLIELAAERVDRSKSIWERTATRESFQRRLIIMEESNTSIPLLTNYWRKIKESGDPYISPAIEAYRSIPAAGRAVKFNLLVICQKGSARAAGGEEIRENTGIKCFGNSSIRTLKNLVEHIKPLPPMYTTPGRVALCVGSTATDVQVAQWIDSKDPSVAAKARAWALAGVPQPVRQDVHTVEPHNAVSPAPVSLSTSGQESVDSDRDSTGTGSEVDWDAELRGLTPALGAADQGLVSLSEACEQGLLRLTFSAAKKARTRALKDGSYFPRVISTKGKTQFYSIEDLQTWEQSRNSKAREEEGGEQL